MSELRLAACPICGAPGSLFRQMIDRQEQPFIWYECRECASVLLWAGGEKWTYQKVGREDKAHLLKKLLTPDDLEALLPDVKSSSRAAQARDDTGSCTSKPSTRSSRPKLIRWLFVLCCLGLVSLATVVVYEILVGTDSFSPRKALLGHWLAPSGGTHYYFSQNRLIMIDQGVTTPLTYTVLESNRKERWVRIRVEKTRGMGHEKLLVFAADRKSLEESSTLLGITVGPTHWDYIDDATEP